MKVPTTFQDNIGQIQREDSQATLIEIIWKIFIDIKRMQSFKQILFFLRFVLLLYFDQKNNNDHFIILNSKSFFALDPFGNGFTRVIIVHIVTPRCITAIRNSLQTGSSGLWELILVEEARKTAMVLFRRHSVGSHCQHSSRFEKEDRPPDRHRLEGTLASMATTRRSFPTPWRRTARGSSSRPRDRLPQTGTFVAKIFVSFQIYEHRTQTDPKS